MTLSILLYESNRTRNHKKVDLKVFHSSSVPIILHYITIQYIIFNAKKRKKEKKNSGKTNKSANNGIIQTIKCIAINLMQEQKKQIKIKEEPH